MYVAFALILCLSGRYGSRADLIDPDHQPRQWQDLVTFVDQKLGNMEHLMTIKDKRIDRLDSEITSLKEVIRRKDAVLSNLVEQVKDLQRRVFLDTTPGTNIESLSLNTPPDRTQHLGDPPTSVNGTSVVPDHPQDVLGDPHTRLTSDGNGEDNTLIQQDASSDVSRSKHYNRVAPSTPRQQVAFHAYRTSTVTLGTQATFIFDHETLDQGDGYNPGDGLYMVPESGTYVITWTMFSYIRNAFQTQLVVNGVIRGLSWTDSDESDDYHQTTEITVLTLKQGDRMFIRMGRIYHGKVFSDSTYAQATFSGWKLD